MSDGGISIDIGGKLSASIEALNDQLVKRERAWVQRSSDAMRNVPTNGNGICPTPTATFSFSIGETQQGRVRALRRVMLGGPLITASPTITAAYLIVSQNDPVVSGALSTETVVDYATSLPKVAFYSNSQIIVRYPEQLWVVVTGATQTQQIVGVAFWQEYLDGGYSAEIEI